MGLTSTLLQLFAKAFLLALLIMLLLFLAPDPDDVDFESVDLRQRVPFENGLAVNSDLDGVEYTDVTVDGLDVIKGPESFAVRDNYLYTGINGGNIIRLNLNNPDNQWESAFQLGQPCFSKYDGSKCGRVLGLTFDNTTGQLIVCYSSLGLVRVDLEEKTSQILVPNTLPVDGKPNKVIHSAVVAQDGAIYYTVASTRFLVHELTMEAFTKGSGRLIKFDPMINSSKVLLDHLNFATGLVIGGPQGDILFVSELGRARIWKYHLAGPYAGQSDVFVSTTPGFVKNLVANGRGGFLAGMIGALQPDKLDVIIDVVFPSKTLNRLFVQLIYKMKRCFELADKYLVGFPLFKRLAYWVGNTQVAAKFVAEPYGLLVEYDSSGSLVRSWHSPKGKVRLVAEGFLHNGVMYIGNPDNEFLPKLIVK